MRYDTKRLLDLLKKSVTNTHSNGIFNMKNPPVVPTGGLKIGQLQITFTPQPDQLGI